jgi:hypothetical protein
MTDPTPEDKIPKQFFEAHAKGFGVGYYGKQVNCPYQPDSQEIVYYDQGIEDGRNFRLASSRQGTKQ